MSYALLTFGLQINILMDNLLIASIFKLRVFGSKTRLKTTKLKLNYFSTVLALLHCCRMRNRSLNNSKEARSVAIGKLARELDIQSFLREHILMRTIIRKSTSRSERALAKHTNPFIANKPPAPPD